MDPIAIEHSTDHPNRFRVIAIKTERRFPGVTVAPWRIILRDNLSANEAKVLAISIRDLINRPVDQYVFHESEEENGHVGIISEGSD